LILLHSLISKQKMDQIKALNDSEGAAIQAILLPTFKIWAPLLVQQKASIQSTPMVTESYGPHPRQMLDLIRSPTDTGNTPVIVFFHGGGLIRGDKNTPQVPENLLYHNLGSFFAQRGITTINANYRRVNSPFGGEDAVFPSGGEDASLVLKWIETTLEPKGKRDVYLLGNSAGGVHASTFVLEPTFLAQRQRYMSGEASITLKGLIDVSVPCHFQSALPGRGEVNAAYYGDAKAVEERCVLGLLQALAKSGMSREEAAVPKALVFLGEYDPEDEIGKSNKDFVDLWKKTWGDEGITFENMPGHNHISPPLALMAGEAKGEVWGEETVKWIKG
jgi:acetyl esterase/lipase